MVGCNDRDVHSFDEHSEALTTCRVLRILCEQGPEFRMRIILWGRQNYTVTTEVSARDKVCRVL